MGNPYRVIEVGTTPLFTWTGSADPSSIGVAVLTASKTIVGSVAAVQSGTGNWYAFITIPDSFGAYPCYLLSEWTATTSTHASSATPFVKRLGFRVTKTTV